MKYLNPLEDLMSASSTEEEQKLSSESMMMREGNICPKCSGEMTPCKLNAAEQALHCRKCRTTGPVPE